MPANELLEETNSERSNRRQQIASWPHLVIVLLIEASVLALGILAQRAPAGTGGAAPGQLASHSKAIPIYLSAILMDCALLYYCWFGVHRRGGNLKTLSGGRWTSWKSVAVDLGIALPCWLLFGGADYGMHWLLSGLLGPSPAKTIYNLLPHSSLEVLIWIGLQITAGICEEMVFRGYLQRQFQALSGSVVVGVAAQGLVFGFGHGYQGWQNVIVISGYGVLLGALAAWRGNVRANIVVHSWGNIWGGWLRFVVPAFWRFWIHK
jgi:hypothetical protein